jgi:hypothetical protein
MPAAAGMQAIAVTPATSNSKDYSNNNDCPQQQKCEQYKERKQQQETQYSGVRQQKRGCLKK